LRRWYVVRRLGRSGHGKAQLSVLAWLARGTLLVVAAAAIVGDQADQEARAVGLMRVDAQAMPFFHVPGEPFTGHQHPCMMPEPYEEEAAPEPDEPPPCPHAR